MSDAEVSSAETMRARVGQRVRALAKQRGVPLTALAERAGTARSYLWSVLNGTASPTVDWLCRIADQLDVEVHEFLTPDKKGARKASKKRAR